MSMISLYKHYYGVQLTLVCHHILDHYNFRMIKQQRVQQMVQEDLHTYVTIQICEAMYNIEDLPETCGLITINILSYISMVQVCCCYACNGNTLAMSMTPFSQLTSYMLNSFHLCSTFVPVIFNHMYSYNYGSQDDQLAIIRTMQ